MDGYSWMQLLTLCTFIGLLSFKPSEPYLSEYLICNYDTQSNYCEGSSSNESCNSENNPPCQWYNSGGGNCGVTNCSSVSYSDCGSDDYNYCYQEDGVCQASSCYKHFTEDQVNDEIYPVSTYAYLPFLFILGGFAEFVSYRGAILLGMSGRLATRMLLLYGVSVSDMQLMQASYALGTAAEDIFSTYIYYVLPTELYERGTSYLKAVALISHMFAGILADLLVVEADTSIR